MSNNNWRRKKGKLICRGKIDWQQVNLKRLGFVKLSLEISFVGFIFM